MDVCALEEERATSVSEFVSALMILPVRTVRSFLQQCSECYLCVCVCVVEGGGCVRLWKISFFK